MKKYISIVLAIILVLSLAGCGSNKKISLPEPDKIKEVEVFENNSDNSVKIDEQDDISKIIEDIAKNAENTGKESVSDQPVNIDNYIIVKFYHKNAEENPSIAYLYKNKEKSYIEQPYSGIWEITETIYDAISSKLAE
ncbi:MAG: DUF5301 domain-containing protein [Peptoniphilus harei]|nr:DUF5301 domain-containing protein [Peptoniphilus harei]